MTPLMSAIVRQAMTQTVVDIGGLSHQQLKDLKQAVKLGWLDKGKGGPYPAIKTVYAIKGYDFEADRERGLANLENWHALDVARKVVSR